MTPMEPEDLSQLSMEELFRLETENQTQILVSGLLAVEKAPGDAARLEILMRAAHSLKGAARLVNLDAAVRITHAMEECFVQAQNGLVTIASPQVDVLLKGIDLLEYISRNPEELQAPPASEVLESQIAHFLNELQSGIGAGHNAQESGTPGGDAATTTAAGEDFSTTPLSEGNPANIPLPPPASGIAPAEIPPGPAAATPAEAAAAPEPLAGGQTSAPETLREATVAEEPEGPRSSVATDNSVRVSAANMDRLMQLTSEVVVSSIWLGKASSQAGQLRRQHSSVMRSQHALGEMLGQDQSAGGANERAVYAEAGRTLVEELEAKNLALRENLEQCLGQLDQLERTLGILSRDLYHCVLDCRMRPFSDGVRGHARMTREIARSLGKDARLEVHGGDTPVDRDILEKLESPLVHLIRNALDHGLETPAERQGKGKAPQGRILLRARHLAGHLVVSVEDDGRGIDLDQLRGTLVTRGLVSPEMSQALSEAELVEFLFLPGFSVKESVTEISGRGVGLSSVQAMVREVGGTITTLRSPAGGTRFELQLPLTLSVIKALLVNVAGEPFAFPLSRTERALKLERSEIDCVEGRQHFTLGQEQIGLIMATQVLGKDDAQGSQEEVSVVVVSDASHRFGVVVDEFLGQGDLVVRPLDRRLGKIQNISAAALMPDQRPVLIVDTEDFLHSIRRLTSDEKLAQVLPTGAVGTQRIIKRVLVVDDSLTVRELERKLIAGRGYAVDVAVDGVDAWNALRSNTYNLVVTDVDMPRMDGIELTARIKRDSRLGQLPVMIVSYKDREEDRRRGLDAGADYYLAKASFHDESLLLAVEDLIGEALV